MISLVLVVVAIAMVSTELAAKNLNHWGQTSVDP
jgi:hypothetical protein